MRQLLPTPIEDIDPFDAYLPPERERPLLRINMISSADGAATDEQGRAGGMAAEGDRRVFRILRAQADAILVGAGTIREEGYGPHRMTTELRRRREDAGYGGPAPIVIVSRSLDIDLNTPLFTEAVTPTVVLTCEAAPEHRRKQAEEVGRVLVAGGAAVDLDEGLRLVRTELGCQQILCEGGPSLNVPLFQHGLVDELCLTFAPLLLGGSGPRILRWLPERIPLRISALLEDGGELFVRYAIDSAT